MADLTKAGEAIEGDAVEGHSRRPLAARTPRSFNGQRCHVWTAVFDVKAWPTKTLPADRARLASDASTSPDDKVVCAKATVLSVKNKVASSVEHRSATHKANVWKFPQQTAIVIDGPHQEIANAVRAR